MRSEFKGEEGFYCLSMPVTNDMAMVGGREMLGFLKKLDISNNTITKNTYYGIELDNGHEGVNFYRIWLHSSNSIISSQ